MRHSYRIDGISWMTIRVASRLASLHKIPLHYYPKIILGLVFFFVEKQAVLAKAERV